MGRIFNQYGKLQLSWRGLSRRRMLESALVAAPALLTVPGARPPHAAAESREVALFNTHTGESLEVTFFAAGDYQDAALRRLDALLRDHRTGDVGVMDPALFDYLAAVARAARAEPRFEVISGYRSAKSNEMLRARGGGVARNSLHLRGKAIDVRLKGVATDRLYRTALDLALGGAGYYAKSDFVHLDTGRVRSWRG